MQSQNDERSVFDWLIFTLIHLVVISAIAYVGMVVYGPRLGLWVAASARSPGWPPATCSPKTSPVKL